SSSEEDSTEQDYSCDSKFKYPTNCSFPNCDYFSSWTFNVSTGLVDFVVKSRPVGHWAGIGFSRNGKMARSDVIIGFIYDNVPHVTDRFAKDNSAPLIDKSQDIINSMGDDDQEIDMQTLYFSRKVDTNDKAEDISLYDCPYYLFPVGGGRISAKNSEEFKSGSVNLEKHETFRPQVSSKPICICKEDNKDEDGRKRRKRQDMLETAYGLTPILPVEPKKLNVRSFIQSN
uniref:DOMON domain-containing protein n=1 Tax=Romanomermis culicivorax TaxID=13658 RepID=A0A915IVD7_ROMCU